MYWRILKFDKIIFVRKRIFGNIFQKNPIRKNLFSLVSGTVVAQLFSLTFYPILTRIFTPEDFGLLSALSAISAIIVVFASGKYEEAIIISRSKEEAINIASLALFFSFLFCSVLLVLLCFFSNQFLNLINQSSLQGWIYLAPIISFFIIIYTTFNEWCVKKATFSKLATNKIINSASINLSKYLFGYIRIGGGLVYGELLGRGLSAFSSFFYWIKDDRASFRNISLKRMRELVIFHINFPKYNILGNSLCTLTGTLPVFFLSSYFGNVVLGYYAMAVSVSAIPMTFIGQSIMDVLRNKASSDFEKDGKCREIYHNFFRKTLLPIVIIFLSILYFFPSIFAFVLGVQWRNSGIFVQILSISIILDFISAILMPIWVIAKKQKNKLYWQFFYLCIMTFFMILGCVIFNDDKMAVVCISIARSLGCFASIYYTWKYSNGSK